MRDAGATCWQLRTTFVRSSQRYGLGAIPSRRSPVRQCARAGSTQSASPPPGVKAPGRYAQSPAAALPL